MELLKWGEGGLSVDKDWQGLLIYFMATVNISVTNDQLSWIIKKLPVWVFPIGASL